MGRFSTPRSDGWRRRRQELAEILTREEGKTLAESLGEIQRSINVIEFFAGEARRMTGETIPSELPHNFCYTVKQPLGPVAVITPWNFPVAIPVWKIAPALVSGDTVVFKPASLTPLTAAIIVEIFQEAGVPPGVLNLVHGGGREVGDTVVRHPAIQAVSFTGSNDVGIGLYGAAAARGIKCQCEMGGKNPIVILDDADLDLAVESAVQGAFGSTGQRCTATSRAVVVDGVANEFVERLEARTSSLVVGNGLDPATQRRAVGGRKADAVRPRLRGHRTARRRTPGARRQPADRRRARSRLLRGAGDLRPR